MNSIVPFNIYPNKNNCLSICKETLSSKIQRVVEFLLFKKNDVSFGIDVCFIKHVFIETQPHLSKEFSRAIQNILNSINMDCMSQKDELFLASVISLIPYAYPEIGDVFDIPTKIGSNEYKVCSFIVQEVIDLTLDNSLSPCKAYGLTSDLGHNILVFLGTTFPGADGFVNGLFADFTPLISVGKIAFVCARQMLNEYFSKYKNVTVYGKSLGGSLALHTLREYSCFIKEVHAVVPAGLHLWDGYQKICDKRVIIILHEGDLVSKTGYFPEHPKAFLFKVSVTSRKVTGLLAHVLTLPGSSCAKITRLNAAEENRSLCRHITTLFHITISFFVFSFLLASFALHKTRRLCAKGK